MKKVTIYDYNTCLAVGSATIEFANYRRLSAETKDSAIVNAGNWLADDALVNNNLKAETTVWFEEIK